MGTYLSNLRNDRGSVLIIGMLTLILLSLIGASSTNTSKIEVEIAGNDRQQKEAFFAAELALATGEGSLEVLQDRVNFDEGTINGHYGEGTAPAPDAMNWTSSDSIDVPSGSLPSGLQGLPAPPRYAMEQRRFRRDSLTMGIGIPTGVYFFNVLSRGTDRSDTAEVVLQTVYAKRFN